jgi:hypothetical protein
VSIYSFPSIYLISIRKLPLLLRERGGVRGNRNEKPRYPNPYHPHPVPPPSEGEGNSRVCGCTLAHFAVRRPGNGNRKIMAKKEKDLPFIGRIFQDPKLESSIF